METLKTIASIWDQFEEQLIGVYHLRMNLHILKHFSFDIKASCQIQSKAFDKSRIKKESRKAPLTSNNRFASKVLNRGYVLLEVTDLCKSQNPDWFLFKRNLYGK